MAQKFAAIVPTPTEGSDIIQGTANADFIDALGGDDEVRAKGGDDVVRGGAGHDKLFGNDGSDRLIGDTGNDKMFGNRGHDRLIWNNGDGSDLMEGGSGHDVVEVNGSNGSDDVFTINPNGARVDFDRVNLVPFSLDIGTTERLEVNGQGGNDQITGAAGLDGLIKLRLDGGEGNDRITGGDGDDDLLGGAGHDVLTGFRGDDRMFGGHGNDRMIWNNGDGSDLMEGGSGHDVVEVNGSNGSDDVFTINPNGARVDFDRVNLVPFSLDIGTTERLEVNGQGGNDQITGAAGLDGLIKLRLDGGEGNDRITGGDGDDDLLGGAGHDVLTGFRGDDRMFGGHGNDRMIWNNGDGSDLMEGGSGHDVVEVNGSNGSDDVFTINPNGARVDFDRVNLVPFSLDIGTTERLEVNGQGGNDQITGAAGLDGLIKLRLDGGEGNDRITGGDGDDDLLGGAGHDVLTGFRGDDRMFGGHGNDRMIWNNGDGSDLMEGGSGHDVVEVNGSNGSDDVFTINPNGARVDFDRVNLVPFSLDIGTTERLEVNGQGGNDQITGAAGLDGLIKLRLDGGEGNDRITGGDGDDDLLGGAGHDVLTGFRGDDRMFGGHGNDRMIWNNGDGSDLMEGGSGHDVVEVNGSNGSDDVFTINPNGARVDFDRVNLVPFSLDIGTTERLEVNGQGGNDQITGAAGLDGLIKLRLDGGDGNDRITGGDGDDDLLGGAGHDVLTGFRGDDRMFGGHGNDRMIWNNGDGSDLMEGGSGHDVVEVNGSNGSDDVFTINPNGARVDFDRVNLVPFSLDIGTTERLEVNGQGGNDQITGAAGLDGLIKLRLDGGEGNDRITGGDGDDDLFGGAGHDVLTGDEGADTFVFEFGSDVITDFENGVDRIKLVGLADDFGDLAGKISASGDDVVIDFGANGLTIEDVSLAHIDSADFVFG